MSNHLAIATATAALGRILHGAAQEGVQAAELRYGPPDVKTGAEGKPLVNLFLYQVQPNAQNRNAHMPGRRADGGIANRSRVALDLRYLLSFYGEAGKFEPERMAGAVAAMLEDRPILDRDAIRKAIADSHAVLGDSDLEEALARIRIVPESHSLEDLSRLWSVLFQVPYALSLGYVLSHVSIETGGPPRTPLPVAKPRLSVAPFARLRIEEVAAEERNAPILWGGALVLHGRGLAAPELALRLGGLMVVPAAAEATAEEIRLPLTAARLGAELRAGFHQVQAVLPAPPGAPAHLTRASEARGFVLRPRVAVLAAGLNPNPPVGMAKGRLRVQFVPAVAAGQEVSLLLDEAAAAAPASATLLPEAPAAFPAAALEFPYEGLKPASYLVRAMVDGVASAPETEADPASPQFGEITGPLAALA
ncbi:DUF4255 domain-containing protein [Falsiroseomonas sp.]|uniref:DUF4255 domain-containing protein n=1 Tax=Falsiroseomonas sp. TaxID=2870721 RepID=UPI0027156775|nr:DUF4255 domain-containing protein [Falsiroseomonas sp.]MDO9499729.1 DUF4255 domain-containing protein [Falsiroseomonas sp.]